MVLDAKRRGSSDTTINGLRPTNVPDHTVKVSAAYRLESIPA